MWPLIRVFHENPPGWVFISSVLPDCLQFLVQLQPPSGASTAPNPSGGTIYEGIQRPISNKINKIAQDMKREGSFQAQGFYGGAIQEC